MVLLSFAAKATLAIRTYGATDILLWEADSEKIRTEGACALYRDGAVLYHEAVPYYSMEFNHPPFMTKVLSFWSWLQSSSGIPLRFWLRFASAVADVLALVLLTGILQRSPGALHPETWVLVAASPASLIVSGFHGNTDPLMIAFVLLAVYLLKSGRPHWLAGAALGMAMNFKVMPIVFLPAVCLFIQGNRQRAQFLAGGAAIFLPGSFPLIIECPRLICQHVFAYTPQSGGWGFSRFASAWMTGNSFPQFAPVAKVVLLATLMSASAWMNFHRKPRPPIELQLCLLSFVFLALTPGFGVQYLIWLVPWTALLSFRQALAFHMSSGMFLFAYYQRAAQGFPWHLANSAATPVWYGSVVYLGLLCWLTICWLAVVSWRRVRSYLALPCAQRA